MKYRIAEWEDDAKPLRWLPRRQMSLAWLAPIPIVVLVGSVVSLKVRAAIFTAMVIGYALRYFLLHRSDDDKEAERARGLLSHAPELSEYLVEMNLYCRGTWYGKDFGALCFVDGWLHFEGPNCNFSIAKRDAKHITRDGSDRIRSDRRISEDLPNRVHYPAEVATYALALRAVSPSDARNLSLALRDWENSSVSPESESVFPPVVPLRAVGRNLLESLGKILGDVVGLGGFLVLFYFQWKRTDIEFPDWVWEVTALYKVAEVANKAIHVLVDLNNLRRLGQNPLKSFPVQEAALLDSPTREIAASRIL